MHSGAPVVIAVHFHVRFILRELLGANVRYMSEA